MCIPKNRKLLREHSYGLNFEKARTIIPELATETKDSYSVAYGLISAPLKEAMKGQQEQIESLSFQAQELIEENKIFFISFF